jgi:hypothetical protein
VCCKPESAFPTSRSSPGGWGGAQLSTNRITTRRSPPSGVGATGRGWFVRRTPVGHPPDEFADWISGGVCGSANGTRAPWILKKRFDWGARAHPEGARLSPSSLGHPDRLRTVKPHAGTVGIHRSVCTSGTMIVARRITVRTRVGPSDSINGCCGVPVASLRL